MAVKDGISVIGAEIEIDGHLILKLSNGEIIDAGELPKANNLYVSNIRGSEGGSLGIFTTTSALQTSYPAASNSGFSAAVGTVAPYAMYISDGVNWVEAAIADANGDFHANVVHRTGTLASLQALVEPVGEIAVATDTPALVLITAAGGKAVYPGGPGGVRPADFANGIPGHYGSGQVILNFPVAGTGGTPGITGLVALATYLEQCSYSPDADVIIQLAAGDYSAGGFSPQKALPNVTLRGVSSASITVSSVTSAPTGTANNWTVPLLCDSTSGWAVGDYLLFDVNAFVSTISEILLAGAWAITEVTNGTNFKILFKGGTPPSAGALAAPYTVYPMKSLLYDVAIDGLTLQDVVCSGIVNSFKTGGHLVNIGCSSTGQFNLQVPTKVSGVLAGQAGFFNLIGDKKNESYLNINAKTDYDVLLSDIDLDRITIAGTASFPTLGYVSKGARVICDNYIQASATGGMSLSAGSSISADTIISVGVTTPFTTYNGIALPQNTMGAELQFVASDA
jgi:hypothetical protein